MQIFNDLPNELMEDVRLFYQHFREDGDSPGLASSRTFYHLEPDLKKDHSLYVLFFLILAEEVALDSQVELSERLDSIEYSLKLITAENDRVLLEAFLHLLNKRVDPETHSNIMNVIKNLHAILLQHQGVSALQTTPYESALNSLSALASAAQTSIRFAEEV